MSISREPLFKGCTRPATLMGVPLVPLIVTVGAAVLVATIGALIWPRAAWLAAIFLATVVLLLMRLVTRRDDQRLAQWMIAVRLMARQAGRRRRHARTYGPVVYRRSV